jgi:hypothetical protein
MDDFSLVPVEHQPDFENVSLVPVDHDPFGAGGVTQPAPTQAARAQTQQASTSNNPEDEAAMSPETYVNPFVKRTLGNLVGGLVTLPQRAIEAAKISAAHNYGPSPGVMSDSDAPFFDPLPSVAAETALTMMGGVGAPRVAGITAKGVSRGVGLDGARGPIDAAEAGAIRVSTPIVGRTLYHYTDEAGLSGILNEGKLNPSLRATNPNDVRYGNGQYLSDIPPGTIKPNELSKAFINNPWQGRKFTHYLEIDPGGLNVLQGRPGVYVVPNETPLNLNGRIVSSGKVPSGWFTSR